ncbi:ABC transporter substrate-binding protein [Ideonella sp. DXS29W]|uniref:ABC transporter substrate-binding protein n=1 Tax=Ideonella lacteola TaxID=2984193 RepID=A0ABU9BLM0_9BURK
MRRRQFTAALGITAFVPSLRAADTGVTDSEVVFGHTGILSGPLGNQIKTMLAGAELALSDSRNQGGIFGRSVRIVSLDDELKPDRAVANYEKLLSAERVFGFFGCVGSATTAAAAPLLQKAGAPWMAGYAVADSAREKLKGTGYFVRASSGREAQALVQHLTTIGVTKIGLAMLDNPGGREASALVESALSAHQLKPSVTVFLSGDGANVKPSAEALASAAPQAVIMYLGGALPGELMKAGWAKDFNPTYYGMSIVAGEVTVKVAGDKGRGLAISQVMPYPWSDADPTAREFRRAADAAKVPVGYYSYEGYINALVLLEALRRTGRDLTRARFASTLRSLKMRVANMDVDFSLNGLTGSRFVELVQVTQDGRFLR